DPGKLKAVPARRLRALGLERADNAFGDRPDVYVGAAKTPLPQDSLVSVGRSSSNQPTGRSHHRRWRRIAEISIGVFCAKFFGLLVLGVCLVDLALGAQDVGQISM